MPGPALSIVVTVVDGGPALERCLLALRHQEGPDSLEVVIPWDQSLAGMDGISAHFPEFHFLPLGTIETMRPRFGPAGQHELFDRRRAAGLAAATAPLVAILEDRGVPRAEWARTLIQLHARLPNAVIGGAIENGRDRLLNWAVYFCDFGRYQLPFAGGPRAYVSDVNISYKRPALEAVRELWRERYHETTVHWALQRKGEELYLDPSPVVDQMRDSLRLGSMLRERIGWGRLFAYTRAREVTPGRRALLAASAPLLPIILFLRLAAHQWRTRRTMGRFILAAPLVAGLLAGWAAGECIGYLAGSP
jgi:hypothetical protein